jgi:tetrapyrrole methylase family protein/MazG family protein
MDKKIDSLFSRLVNIMSALRGEQGCPWDKEQDRNTLKPFLIEESYEVMEAIDEGAPEKIKEELGDLLFQILFHARISQEEGVFDITDVLNTISEKMIRRHPHVFGDTEVKDSQEVLVNWEQLKAQENNERQSAVDGVPKALPALIRAQRVQEKASRVGFDWPDLPPVLEKFKEEVQEFSEALSRGDKQAAEDEMGDLLFTLVNVSRFLNIGAEGALNNTTKRFIERFKRVEKEACSLGRSLSEMTLEEMDRLWYKAKKKPQDE